LARHDLQKHPILVEVVSNPQQPHAIGERIQLQRMLLNLNTNAIEAVWAIPNTPQGALCPFALRAANGSSR
jgi:C4-dicarboxylate-specific signal transduction histidine kinase